MLSTTRGERKLAYFEHFSEGIWGGGRINSLVGGYAHDLFLDTYDEAGIFALLGVICFMARSAYVLLKMLKNRNIKMYRAPIFIPPAVLPKRIVFL